MNQLDFESRYLERGTWQISGEGCNCYLLEGGRESVMIDAGCSHADICQYAQTLTDKPIRGVVNTHSHFDHTGGNGYFKKVYITEAASKSAKTVMDSQPSLYPLDYEFTFISEGDVIDIEGRPLRVVGLGCHSPGNIALLDETARLLYCGDEVDAGQVLLLPGYAEKAGQIHAAPAGTVEDCLASMEKMIGLGKYYDALCPAHNGALMAPIYLHWLAELCRGILDGSVVGSPDCSSRSYRPEYSHYPLPGAGYLRAQHKGASLIYNGRLLRQADAAAAHALPPATRLHLTCAWLTPDAVNIQAKV